MENHTQSFKQRRRNGWDMNLYRNTRRGKIAGVCAGLADHFDIEPWVVRLIAVAAFLYLGLLIIYAYIAGCFLLTRKCSLAQNDRSYDRTNKQHSENAGHPRKHMFKYEVSAGTRLREAKERLANVRQRVEDVERYVTSRKYELNQEFAKMGD